MLALSKDKGLPWAVRASRGGSRSGLGWEGDGHVLGLPAGRNLPWALSSRSHCTRGACWSGDRVFRSFLSPSLSLSPPPSPPHSNQEPPNHDFHFLDRNERQRWGLGIRPTESFTHSYCPSSYEPQSLRSQNTRPSRSREVLFLQLGSLLWLQACAGETEGPPGISGIPTHASKSELGSSGRGSAGEPGSLASLRGQRSR